MSVRERDVHSSLFTVRVWPEEVAKGRVEWRGKVQSVTNGEALFFRDWDSMMAFIRDSSYQLAGDVGQQPKDGEEGEG
jgi:hypothetical protein